MREIAHVSIRGDFAAREAFEAAWNTTHDCQFEWGSIVIDKAHPEYVQLRPFFEQKARELELDWEERYVTREYTEAELHTFALLQLWQVGDAGEGNNTYAPVYRSEVLCAGCGRVAYHQERNLVLDLLQQEPDAEEIGYFQHDICATRFGETVVSQRVKDLLEAHQVPGVQCRRVEHCDPAVPDGTLPVYYQLLIEPEIGPLLDRGKVVRERPCAQCGEFREVHRSMSRDDKDRESYYGHSSYSGAWIMRSTDRFGVVPKLTSDIIISQRLYRLLQEHDITGFWVQPVHLVDD